MDQLQAGGSKLVNKAFARRAKTIYRIVESTVHPKYS